MLTLVTVLTDAEAVVNFCQLVYVDDINSSIIFTPTDFMCYLRGLVFPNIVDDPDPDPEIEVAKRVKFSQALLHAHGKVDNIVLTNFGTLKSKRKITSKRSKNVPNPPKIGSVVLVKENLPCGHWNC